MGLTHGGRTFFNTLELKRIREEEEAEEEVCHRRATAAPAYGIPTSMGWCCAGAHGLDTVGWTEEDQL